MSPLSVHSALGLAGAAREILIEADDAVRDALTALEEDARAEGLELATVRSAATALLAVAAARQATAARPHLDAAALEAEVLALTREALAWTRSRADAFARSAT